MLNAAKLGTSRLTFGFLLSVSPFRLPPFPSSSHLPPPLFSYFSLPQFSYQENLKTLSSLLTAVKTQAAPRAGSYLYLDDRW